MKLVVSDGANSDSITKTGYIMINAPPTVQAGNNFELCIGDSVRLNGSGALTYSWSPYWGLSNSSISNPNLFIHVNDLDLIF